MYSIVAYQVPAVDIPAGINNNLQIVNYQFIYLFIDLIKVPTTEYKYIKYTSIN